MKSMANYITKPRFSLGSFFVGALVGNLIVDGHWITAGVIFVVGFGVLEVTRLFADEAAA